MARRTTWGIATDVGHVEKWQPALDMIDEIRSWGIDVPLVVADRGYGDAAAFRLGLEERDLNYVVGISITTTAHTETTAAYSDLRRSRPEAPAGLSRAGPDGEEAGHRGRQASRPAGAVF